MLTKPLIARVGPWSSTTSCAEVVEQTVSVEVVLVTEWDD